jgi:hypothetical protein
VALSSSSPDVRERRRWRRASDAVRDGDAFRVTRAGKTVTVVNAPTAAALDDVHD